MGHSFELYGLISVNCNSKDLKWNISISSKRMELKYSKKEDSNAKILLRCAGFLKVLFSSKKLKVARLTNRFSFMY